MEANTATTPSNVFNLITDDIPRERFNAIVQLFKEHEAAFAEYLDKNCNQEDYLTKDNQPSEQKSEQYEIRVQKDQRGIFAKKIIKQATIVMESDPIVAVLGTDHAKNYCSTCFNASKNLK